jgi:hypothetical protein
MNILKNKTENIISARKGLYQFLVEILSLTQSIDFVVIMLYNVIFLYDLSDLHVSNFVFWTLQVGNVSNVTADTIC